MVRLSCCSPMSLSACGEVAKSDLCGVPRARLCAGMMAAHDDDEVDKEAIQPPGVGRFCGISGSIVLQTLCNSSNLRSTTGCRGSFSTSTTTSASARTLPRFRSRSALCSSLRRATTTGGGYDHRAEVVVLSSSDVCCCCSEFVGMYIYVITVIQ